PRVGIPVPIRVRHRLRGFRERGGLPLNVRPVKDRTSPARPRGQTLPPGRPGPARQGVPNGSAVSFPGRMPMLAIDRPVPPTGGAGGVFLLESRRGCRGSPVDNGDGLMENKLKDRNASYRLSESIRTKKAMTGRVGCGPQLQRGVPPAASTLLGTHPNAPASCRPKPPERRE